VRKGFRVLFVATALTAATAGLALQAAAGPTNHANQLDATFTETNASVTNRIGDLGTFQLINTAAGTVEGFGAATGVVSVTQDRSVHPCGPGSWTNAGLRRIVLDEGVLMLREVAYVCPTASGPVATGTWDVDGASSTGAFTGARGSGEIAVVIATGTSTLSGRLKLAGSTEE
jgi:hypothetical protein